MQLLQDFGYETKSVGGDVEPEVGAEGLDALRSHVLPWGGGEWVGLFGKTGKRWEEDSPVRLSRGLCDVVVQAR
jgi:hypothetical protein